MNEQQPVKRDGWDIARMAQRAAKNAARKCADCGTSIAERGRGAKICLACATIRVSYERTKEMRKAASRKRNLNPKRIAYLKAWNEAHPQDRRAYKKKYDAAHKEANTKYRASRRGITKQQNAERYKATRDKVIARVKAYSEVNKKRILAYQAAYYVANTDKVKANVAKYQADYPEKKKHLQNRRRARLFNNGGSHTLDEIQDKFNAMGNVCFYCGRNGKLTVDHDVPLSRGGTDDISNILPACKPCNSSKNAKTSLEFISQRRSVVL